MSFWNLPDVTADSDEPTGFPGCAYPSPIRSSKYISLHETLIRHTVQYLWKLNLLREGWTLLGLNRHIQSEINSWPKFVKTNTSIIALMMLDSFDLRKITQSIVTSLKYLKISVVVTVFFSLLNFACWQMVWLMTTIIRLATGWAQFLPEYHILCDDAKFTFIR